MVYNEIYKQYAWQAISDQYAKNMKDLFAGLLKILNKNHKVLLKPDGSLMVDINNMSPFFLYTGEFFSFLQVCTEKMADNEVISSDRGKRILTNQFAELTSSFNVGDVGLDEDAYSNRPKDYKAASEMNTVRCESAGIACSSEAEKYAAVFADCVIASEIENDFCSYDLALDDCESYDNKGYARALFDYAVDVYHTVKKQVDPYIDGSIVSQRKAKGICPNCGGSYKGLFSKKCGICGTPKEK
jgi:hypothetical protein